MFFVAALVICLIIRFRFPKGKSIERIIINIFRNMVKQEHLYFGMQVDFSGLNLY